MSSNRRKGSQDGEGEITFKKLPAADRAEAKLKAPIAAVAEASINTKPGENPTTLVGVMNWFERIRKPIDIEADIAGLSDADSRVLKSQIDIAHDWLGLIGTACRSRATAETNADAMEAEGLMCRATLTDGEDNA